MARPLRIEFPGACYHITSRGNARQSIFLDDSDRSKFLQVLSMVVERYRFLCHAYCLMDNHYHMIIETPDGNLSIGMRQLNGVYTQSFNRRHRKVGHLFQGRYKAILVDRDSYLLSVCRYVVLNPVRAGMVERPKAWKWSSYRATVERMKSPPFLTTEWILSQFGTNRSEAIAKYKKFVLIGINEESPWKALKGQILLGTDTFIEGFRYLLKEKEGLKEVPRVQRYATRPALNEMFAEGKFKDKKLKDEAIYGAHIHYGYTLKEIAEQLGVHYVTISRVIKQVEGV